MKNLIYSVGIANVAKKIVTNRILIVTILSVLSAVNMQAQMRWGVEAGVNTVMGADLDKKHVGFNVGATAEYSISSHWLAEATLKLSSQPCGKTIRWDNYNATGDYVSPRFQDITSYNPYYLALPIRIGYRLNIAENAKVIFAAGPSIGIGLWGKGSFESYDMSSGAELLTEEKTTNIFDASEIGYLSSSRFEYGASIKVGVELKRHFAISAEYDFKHISGQYKTLNNLDILSINFGYKF